MKDEKTKRSPRVIGTFEERIVTWACAQDVLDRMKRSPQFKGIDLDSLSTRIVSFLAGTRIKLLECVRMKKMERKVGLPNQATKLGGFWFDVTSSIPIRNALLQGGTMNFYTLFLGITKGMEKNFKGCKRFGRFQNGLHDGKVLKALSAHTWNLRSCQSPMHQGMYKTVQA